MLRKKDKPYVIHHIQHNLKKSQEEKEKYFHSLVMPFSPWRNEDELNDGSTTYEEMFNKKKSDLLEMMQHHEKLSRIIETVELAESNLNTNTQSSHLQANEIDDINNAMCLKEINEAEQAMAEVVTNVRAGISLEDVNKAIINLNIDQTRIFSNIKAILTQIQLKTYESL